MGAHLREYSMSCVSTFYADLFDYLRATPALFASVRISMSQEYVHH